MAVTQLEFLVALVLGIAPALAVMWGSLRRFDRPRVEHTLFDDRKVFTSLAVGLVFGVFVSYLNVALRLNVGIVASAALLAGVLLAEELFKVAFLNRRGYRGRFDATFYGVPLGVGAAATGVVASVAWAPGGFPSSVEAFGLVVLFSIGLSLVNATTGAVIGFGASRSEMVPPLIRALVIRFAHTALLFPVLVGAEVVWTYVSASTALVFASIVFRYAYAELLPGTLPEDLRRQLRRARRRAQVVKE
jgi:hypothetical protein